MRNNNLSESKNISLGIVISYISLFVSIIGGIFVTPRILNALGDSQYGLYSFATSIASWLTVISGAISASYIKFATAENKERGTTGKTNTLYFKMFGVISILLLVAFLSIFLILYFSGFKLSQYTQSENNLIYLLLLISSLNIFINLFFSVFNHFNLYKKKFVFTRSLALLISILTYTFEVIFAILTKSVISVAIITLCLSVLSVFVTILYSKKKLNIPFEKTKLSKNPALLKNIIIFSSIIVLNSIVDRVNNDVDKTILGIMVDSQSVTTYTLSKIFNAYLLTLSISISSSFVPRVHELVSFDKKDELNLLFLKVSTVQLLILCFVIGGFISCGYSFVSLWLGESRIQVFYHAIPFLILDIVALSCNLCIEIQRAKNKHKFRAFLYIALALINVAISILMVYLLPASQAVWGVTIGTVISVVGGNWIILNIYNKKVVGLPIGKYYFIVLRFVIYMGVAVVFAIVPRYLIPNHLDSYLIEMIRSGTIFVSIYVLLVFLFEKKTIKNIIGKLFKKQA